MGGTYSLEVSKSRWDTQPKVVENNRAQSCHMTCNMIVATMRKLTRPGGNTSLFNAKKTCIHIYTDVMPCFRFKSINRLREMLCKLHDAARNVNLSLLVESREKEHAHLKIKHLHKVLSGSI